MKRLPAILLLALLLPCSAHAEESGSEQESEKTSPAHTPEWTDHNIHDPGATAKGTEASGRKAAVAPSQTKELVAPSAAGARKSCPATAGATSPREPAEHQSGSIRFGDGEHGRVPQSQVAGCEPPGNRADPRPEPERQEGDPDRPVIIGDLPNPEQKD